MARMKFFVDTDRCIRCYGCQVACSSAHELPVGIYRRKVITLHDGIEGKEVSTTIACQHCTDAPCEQVCPVDCFYIRAEGIVLHDKNICIGCGYCLYACPFGAPQFPKDGAFGVKGVMDKCTMCAAVCATNALLVGDAADVSNVYRKRVMLRNTGLNA